MLLNNYRKICEAVYLTTNLTSDSSKSYTNHGVTCVPASGDTSQNYYVVVNDYVSSLCGNFNRCRFMHDSTINSLVVSSSVATSKSTGNSWIHLAIGDGIKDVEPTDYWLSGNTLALTSVAVDNVTSLEGDSFKRILKYTVRNDTGASVTVNEYGFLTPIAYINSTLQNSSNPESYFVMFERTKLDTPIIMADGETASFELVFESTLPTIG